MYSLKDERYNCHLLEPRAFRRSAVCLSSSELRGVLEESTADLWQADTISERASERFIRGISFSLNTAFSEG